VALNSPIAAEAVERIDALYTIEREIRGLDPEARLRERQAREVPLLEDLYSWLTATLAKLPRSSALARAIRYTHQARALARTELLLHGWPGGYGEQRCRAVGA
jgi:hypothetical protein